MTWSGLATRASIILQTKLNAYALPSFSSYYKVIPDNTTYELGFSPIASHGYSPRPHNNAHEDISKAQVRIRKTTLFTQNHCGATL